MKKILLIVACLMLCGCYDYKELNQIAIIGAIGIDYDNGYKVALEIINDKKQDQSGESKTETIIITGEDEEFIDAMLNAIRQIDRDPYFYQTQLLILGEGMARKGVDEIFDFLLRDSKISNTLYTVISKGSTPEEVLKTSNEMEPIVSSRIVKLMEDGTTFAKVDQTDEFDLMVGTYLKPGIDLSLNAVEIENEELTIKSVGIFDNDRLVSFLDINDGLTYSELMNPNNAVFLSSNGDSVETHNNKSSIEYKDGRIIVTYQADATIKVIDDDVDLKVGKVYEDLSRQFSDNFKAEIESLITKIRFYNSDILGFGNIIYMTNKNDYQENIGNIIDYEVKVEINVNKNGLTFEVIE